MSSSRDAARGGMVLRAATSGDCAAVRTLLRACDLPVAGVDEAAMERFVVVERDGAIIGVAGLEIYGRDALLRSVAVSAEARTAGLGSALTEQVLAQAPVLGVQRVYLLTTTAESFFARRGFAAADRAGVSAEMQASVEFREACPASAALMLREL